MSYEEPENKDEIRKDKDPKSFTQNLFDTVAMKLLHRANASTNHPPWAPSNERAQLDDSSNLNRSVTEPKMDGKPSMNAEQDGKKPLTPETESTRVVHGYNLSRNYSIPDNAPIGNNSTSSDVAPISGITQNLTSLGKGLANTEASGLGAAEISSKVLQPDPRLDEIDAAGIKLLQKTAVSAAGQSKPILDFPARSLSHFTRANIIALREVWVTCHSELPEQHSLLKLLGRTDLPQNSSGCGSYGDFLAYSGQSMIYILSNVDALLQSFLQCDDSNAAFKVVRPYDFPLIVDLFRKLRRIDMHPHKIFPSLWISASRLYPVSAVTSKRRPLTASDLDQFAFDLPPIPQSWSLNDLEACHVVKVILAALVASVPKCSPMSWLAVRRLHASGRVSPFAEIDNSPAEQRLIGKLGGMLQAFENDMALGLVKRLARSIDIRYHLARARVLADNATNAEKNRRLFPHILSRVLDYVNADSLKICVADNEGQASLKCGEWIDPEIESITWHRKEWPIIIEWLRAVILKEWDGKAKVAKGSAVGGALGLMLHIRK